MQLHLYHGDGKGKTTAALGQALRAWGRGWRVLVVQFLKDSRAPSGETAAARRLGPRFELLRSRLPAPVLRDPGLEGRRALARDARSTLSRALERVAAGSWDLVVLDEALAANRHGLLTVRALGEAVRACEQAGVRLLVLTGRRAPRTLLRRADLVTEVRKQRHPFDRGQEAVDGIEY